MNKEKIRICVHEYVERTFASYLLHRNTKQENITNLKTHSGDGKWRSHTPSLFHATWTYLSLAIKTAPSPVPAGPLNSWPKTAQ